MALSDTSTPISCQDDEENDSPIDKNLTREKTFDLQPVSLLSSGKGLPYAPEGWPNPGDVWGWKVGTRMNKAGFFIDRFLYPPKSLQISSTSRQSLRTKLDVERYIVSNFPNMKVQDFFDLFSWQIPSTGKTPTKAVQCFLITPPGKSVDTGEDSTEEIGSKRKLKRKMQICSPPTEKSSRKHMKLKQKTVCGPPNRKSSGRHHVRPRLAADVEENTSIDLCSSSPDQDANGFTNVTCSLNEEARINATEKETDMQTAAEKYPNETTVLENFNDYLDNLEGMLDTPCVETSPNHVASAATIPDNEMIECCKKKLSFLLAADFSSLVSSCNGVSKLASQIRKDPTLSVDQLTQLKLVEQIPLVSEVFQDAKGDIEEADKFLSDLEAKKQKVIALKNEYKDKEAQIESEIATSSLAIQEIDDQIQQLESKRNKISSALETMQKSKANVADSIVTLVGEIQVELSEKSKWELKKANSAQRVAELQEKFSTLKGLTF